MTRKEQLEKKIRENKEETKKAQAELNRINRKEAASARAAARQKQIDEYVELCEAAKTIPSSDGKHTLYDEFRQILDSKRVVSSVSGTRTGERSEQARGCGGTQ